VTESWPPCDGPASRAAMAARIASGDTDGFLAPAMFAAAGIVEIARHDNLNVARKSLR
jgi:hypothetical protein